MKWTNPKVGDVRIRRKFAWFPIGCPKSARRWWLCRVWVREVYSSPPAALTDYAGLWWATEAVGDAREDVEPTPEPTPELKPTPEPTPEQAPEPQPCQECRSNLGKRLQAQRAAAYAKLDAEKLQARLEVADAEAEKQAVAYAKLDTQNTKLETDNSRLHMHLMRHQGELSRLQTELQKAVAQSSIATENHNKEMSKLEAENQALGWKIEFLEKNNAVLEKNHAAALAKAREAKP
jgi:hypothetical protein